MSEQRTVTISLSPELAKRVDAAAGQEGRSRSELFREALRQYLERQDRWERIFALGEDTAKRTQLDEAAVMKAVKSRRRASAKE
jgi:metal-responsive CopG/Arc/MetJ family transcriptional regulator